MTKEVSPDADISNWKILFEIFLLTHYLPEVINM